VWAGRPDGLEAEAQNLLRLVAALLADDGHAVTIHPEETPGARWAGDALEPVEPTPDDPDPGSLVLFTSGTTGVPKRAQRRLHARAGAAPEPDAVWLLAYAPQRWAGVSVLVHVVSTGAQLAVPKSFESDELIDAAAREGVTHMSLTPSLFRKMLLQEGRERLSALPLRQVTFGGEAATQGALDAAAELWPQARLTHVLATTETGDLCAVSDGRAGFPVAVFAKEGREIAADGELTVDGRPTGDLWREEDGRYHFVGRRDEVINVGGENVSPLAVEAAAEAVSGVRYARAFAVASPLLGHVVALDYVGAIEERDLQRALRASLPRPAAPARVRRVESVELTQAGKTRRAPVT
jgi:acyl-CoA synthetase (AMP-forming)/AMP-acid ligase II